VSRPSETENQEAIEIEIWFDCRAAIETERAGHSELIPNCESSRDTDCESGGTTTEVSLT